MSELKTIFYASENNNQINARINALLNEFSLLFNNIKIEEKFDINNVTHVILPSYQHYKGCLSLSKPFYVYGILYKKFVINIDWIKDSIKNKTIQNEENYECVDNCFNELICQKSRLSNDLFKKFLFSFNDSDNMVYQREISLNNMIKFSQEDIKKLIFDNGGTLLTNNDFDESNKIHINLYANEFNAPNNQEHVPHNGTLNIYWIWILFSLKEYKLRPINYYLIDDNKENVPAKFKHLISDNVDEIFRELCNVFPYVENKIIYNLVKRRVQGVFCNLPIHRGNILNNLSNFLIENGHKYEKKVEEIAVNDNDNIQEININENYEKVIGIFPEIDPTYLLKEIEKKKTELEINELIDYLLEADYPTKKDYLKKINISEQQKKLGENFNVEEFLNYFPNPFEYFEDPKRKCKFDPFGLEFLKVFFNQNKVLTIKKLYNNHYYNLSRTANALRILGKDMKSKRYTYLDPIDNIPLLQEIAYIKNYEAIKNCLDVKKKLEDEMIKLLEEKNQLLTCECCYNDKVIPEKSISCNKRHNFCQECLIAGVETALGDGKYRINCFSECESELPLNLLQKLLPPQKFSQFLKNNQLQEIEAAGITGLETCPFCSEFVSIPPAEDKIFKCQNPDCWKESCRACKKANHIPRKCNEKKLKEEKLRHLIEEKMTEALIRHCLKCKKPFVKEEGCNKMCCPSCNTKMCYLCNKEIQDYGHFNPQGGARTDLCPLWSDDKYMEAEGVRKIGQDLQNMLIKENPDLSINVDQLLPKLPEKSQGYHTTVVNAYEQPAHIKKLVEDINVKKK